MFTQRENRNTLYCNGCHLHCKYGATVLAQDGRSLGYFPTLNNQVIKTYTELGGEKITIRGELYQDLAIKHAIHIATLCDHYRMYNR